MNVRIPSGPALLLAGCFAVSCATVPGRNGEVHQATGLKIGEVTATSAVVWTRGTRKKERGMSQAELDDWLQVGGWADAGLPDDFSDMVMVPENEPGLVKKALKTGGAAVKAPAKLISGGGESAGVLAGVAPVNVTNGVLRLQTVPGARGEVQLRYAPVGQPAKAMTTRRLSFRKSRDYTRQFALENLEPDTSYEVTVSVFRHDEPDASSTRRAVFRTAPLPVAARPVRFTVVTGQAYRTTDDRSSEIFASAVGSEFERKESALKGHRIYPEMLALAPDFMVHTGDVVYYDHQGSVAKSQRTARIWWQRMFSLSNMVEFHERVPVYYMKDDHDTLMNDCWPGQRHRWLSYKEGRAIFHEQTPLSLESGLSINDGKPYRTVRWGRHLQIWLTEVRDYRDPNTKDATDPDKTMLGEEQIEWLESTLAESDATFRLVICQGPIVGPDRPEEPDEEEKKHLINRLRPPRIDNIANPAWRMERERLLNILDRHKNLILIVGDRHWKYHSVWPSKTEPRLHELSCGSVSDAHARSGLRMIGVPTPEQDETLVWRDEVEQGGFISVEVDPGAGGLQPSTTVRFHKVDGSPAYPPNTAGRREVVFRADGTVTFAR